MFVYYIHFYQRVLSQYFDTSLTTLNYSSASGWAGRILFWYDWKRLTMKVFNYFLCPFRSLHGIWFCFFLFTKQLACVIQLLNIWLFLLHWYPQDSGIFRSCLPSYQIHYKCPTIVNMRVYSYLVVNVNVCIDCPLLSTRFISDNYFDTWLTSLNYHGWTEILFPHDLDSQWRVKFGIKISYFVYTWPHTRHSDFAISSWRKYNYIL